MRALVIGLGLTLAACGGGAAGPCETDADCGGRLACIEGECRCRTDDACSSGEYCNPFGTCQPRPPCLGNQDCEAGFICNSSDPSGGKCIPDGQCGASSHCAFNFYCDTAAAPPVCVPGCRASGDCQLGYICSGGACVRAASGTDCFLCPTDPRDASYCDYGEVCTAGGQCQSHSQSTSLCLDCTASNCPAGLTCLIDDAVVGGNYCSPSCTADTDCPSGYNLGCSGLSLVSPLSCSDPTAFGPCDCTDGSACPNGGRCLQAAEGQNAFCECLTQADCDFFAGICEPTFGVCLISCTGAGDTSCARYGTTCTNFLGLAWLCGPVSCESDSQCLCLQNRCVGTDLACTSASQCQVSCDEGSCVTNARACGKDTGVMCTDLRDPATSPCRPEP